MRVFKGAVVPVRVAVTGPEVGMATVAAYDWHACGGSVSSDFSVSSHSLSDPNNLGVKGDISIKRLSCFVLRYKLHSHTSNMNFETAVL